ncbi:unnamed protein product [Kuraishia capsulata CBS 1993]|uniref:Repressor of RNA polymerase III transcription MAF1 n=1 Tax=Kuraishia capsulata CBS 1993 TaxID=1382522 RepID=W6MMU4_9ASCO|nr:uncharacterized protein KUCA_T00002288001 [Kuraishia capsulata CBS 1993]CDK26317.1 unnamed protein product [Kuraishia capsulata CBS 1993]
MKFIDEFDIELVNQFLTFDTNDTHIDGGCDLFTTKPVGSDRKLYKTIDKHLDRLLEENEIFANSNLQNSPPSPAQFRARRASSSAKARPVLSSLDRQQSSNALSRSYHYSPYISPKSLDSKSLGSKFPDESKYWEDSPFGPLSEPSSRKTFAYLIAILNASYPDHDFSYVQPDNFKALSSSAELISKFNSLLLSLGRSQDLNWMWETINSHMDLADCVVYLYEPEESFLNDLSPGTLWFITWFVYNKKRKRVAFLNLRASVLKNNYTPRRNSKVNTLDEEEGEDLQEYDLRDGYEDAIMSDDEEDEDDDDKMEDDMFEMDQE